MTIRHVRNFWVETRADGRNRTDATGPKGAGGGVYTEIYIRHQGSAMHVATIKGEAFGDNLRLDVKVYGKCEVEKRTDEVNLTVRSER